MEGLTTAITTGVSAFQGVVNDNLAIVVPVGFGIFAAIAGVKMLPGLIKSWVRG